jgi:SSS family solute:Na+ symporter
MNFTALDYSFLAIVLMVLLGITVYSRRYVRGVTDFLAADRLAGRYLLTVAGGFYGTVGLVANWEMIYATGLPPQWWGMMNLRIVSGPDRIYRVPVPADTGVDAGAVL